MKDKLLNSIVLTVIISIMILSACEFNLGERDGSAETIILNADQCMDGPSGSSICLDSVYADSRCPANANCVWAGNAMIALNITTKDNVNHIVTLNTNADFARDTIVENILIQLKALTPYPEIGIEIQASDYVVELMLADKENLQCNASVLSFSADKCGCCWGWTIKIGEDTIRTEDVLVGNSVGYDRNYPVDVYVRLGDTDSSCTGMFGRDYYWIEEIVECD